jgi:hypothetical protein
MAAQSFALANILCAMHAQKHAWHSKGLHCLVNRLPKLRHAVAFAHCANPNPNSQSQNKAELSGHTITARRKDGIKKKITLIN